SDQARDGVRSPRRLPRGRSPKAPRSVVSPRRSIHGQLLRRAGRAVRSAVSRGFAGGPFPWMRRAHWLGVAGSLSNAPDAESPPIVPETAAAPAPSPTAAAVPPAEPAPAGAPATAASAASAWHGPPVGRARAIAGLSGATVQST